MLIEMLLIFIIVSVILFIFSLYTMEENPMLAIPLIMVNIVFVVLIMYGITYVEWFYIAADGTPTIYSTMTYANPYAYVFLVFMFIQIMLLIKTGFNLVQEGLKE